MDNNNNLFNSTDSQNNTGFQPTGTPSQETPNYQNAPNYQNTSGCQNAANNPNTPNYQNAPNYQGTPNYQNAPNYQGTPNYQSAPNYQRTPNYQNAPNFYQGSPYFPNAANKVAGVGTFFGLQLLFSLPIIGLIACIICAFAPENQNVKNYARATLIWLLIAVVLTSVFYVVLASAGAAIGGSFNRYY